MESSEHLQNFKCEFIIQEKCRTSIIHWLFPSKINLNSCKSYMWRRCWTYKHVWGFKSLQDFKITQLQSKRRQSSVRNITSNRTSQLNIIKSKTFRFHRRWNCRRRFRIWIVIQVNARSKQNVVCGFKKVKKLHIAFHQLSNSCRISAKSSSFRCRLHGNCVR